MTCMHPPPHMASGGSLLTAAGVSTIYVNTIYLCVCVRVCEAQKKRGKLRCLLLRQKKIFFYIYDVITWGGKKSAANHYLCVCVCIHIYSTGVNPESSSSYDMHASSSSYCVCACVYIYIQQVSILNPPPHMTCMHSPPHIVCVRVCTYIFNRCQS